MDWNYLQKPADYYGLKSVRYEGGPDLNAETDLVLAELASGDHRMNQLIQAQLVNFYGCGNDLFMFYKLAAPAGDTWGAYEDITIPTEKSKALNTVAVTPMTAYTVCTPTLNNQLFIQ